MQSFSVAARAILVAAGIAQAIMNLEEERKIYEGCQVETGTNETFEDIVVGFGIPTTDEGACQLDCIGRKRHTLDENSEYDEEGDRAWLGILFEDEPNKDEIVEKFLGIVKECSSSPELEGLDKCEKSVKLRTCVKEKDSQHEPKDDDDDDKDDDNDNDKDDDKNGDKDEDGDDDDDDDDGDDNKNDDKDDDKDDDNDTDKDDDDEDDDDDDDD